jgi:hypothetical protein
VTGRLFFSIRSRIGKAQRDLDQRLSSMSRFTAASRIPPWLASGWGCRGRRLSTTLENPDMRFERLEYVQRGLGLSRGSIVLAEPTASKTEARDALTIPETHWLPVRGDQFAGGLEHSNTATPDALHPAGSETIRSSTAKNFICLGGSPSVHLYLSSNHGELHMLDDRVESMFLTECVG